MRRPTTGIKSPAHSFAPKTPRKHTRARSSATWLVCMVAILLSSSAMQGNTRAADPPRTDRVGPQIAGDSGLGLRPDFDAKLSSSPSKLGPDLLFLYGAPGSNEGTFQDLAGQPDWQGWTSLDVTEATAEDSHWHVYEAPISPPPIELTASNAAERFGASLIRVDSLAGDARVTLVAASTSTISGNGSARIYLGQDIALDTPTWTTFRSEEGYGVSLADMGDIDGDGDHELLVGATSTSGAGAAYAYFGEPGVGLDNTIPDLVFAPDLSAGSFGKTVAGIGDFNGDGYDDWAIQEGKKLYVYFGSAVPDASWDLQLPFTHVTVFGWCISGGDIDGDGYSDLLVGEPGGGVLGLETTWPGRVHIFYGSSSPSLSIGNWIDGDQPGGGFGASIAIIPPMDGGAAQSILVGEPFSGGDRGAVHLYEGGRPPVFTRNWYGNLVDGEFGWSVTALDLLVPPGNTAFAVGRPGAGTSGVFGGRCSYYIAGPDSSMGNISAPSTSSRFGEVVVDGKGIFGAVPVLVASAPMHDDPGGLIQAHILGTSGPMLYCGDESPPPEWVGGPGYGDNWNDILGWYRDVTDPGQSTHVCLDLTAHIETEETYDFVFFEYQTSAGYTQWAAITGIMGLSQLHYCATYTPADYVTNPFTGNPAVHLRVRVHTDGIGSDESGLFFSELGAVLLRDMVVSMDGMVVSTASIQPDGSDDSPDGLGFAGFATDTWFREEFLFGDFAKLIEDFTDLDPLRENPTPQVSFIDDGSPPRNDPLGRSTGGSLGSTNYGVPGNWVLNYTGGLSDSLFTLHNEVWSPPIAWDDTTSSDDDAYDYAVLGFDAWLDLPRYNGFYYSWKVRHSLDPAAASWQPWVSDNFVYYSYGDPHYETLQLSIGDRVPPEARWVQVALVAWDLARAFGYPGGDATPSPTFDNVRVFKQFKSVTTVPTPAGNSVVVDHGEIQIEFDAVSGAGVTTVVREAVYGRPANFYLATDPKIAYQITTTAVFYDSVTICINYDDADLVLPEEQLKLIHLEENEWVDTTRSLDTVGNVICGRVASLSPFALAMEVSPTSTPPERTPSLTRLHPPHPNPFNPRTTIRYELAHAGQVELSIHDVRGRLVQRLESGPRAAGAYETIWQGRDDSGSAVASGVYFIRLVTPTMRMEQKVTLVR